MAEHFTGGEQFKTKLAQLMRDAGKPQMLRVGFLENSTCGMDNNESAPQVAFWLEFGTMRVIAKQKPGSLNMQTQNMPPRPFFQRMITDKSPHWPDQFAVIMRNNNCVIEKSLIALGQLIADQLQKAIIDFQDPPDSPVTIARKAFKGRETATLQESKNLLRSVSFEVVTGGVE
jgi:hypothetical protein